MKLQINKASAHLRSLLNRLNASKQQVEQFEIKSRMEEKQRGVSTSNLTTRSQGPATIGQEVTQEIIDKNGNLVWRGMAFELAGKQYNTPDYVLNLIKPSKSNDIKIFKEAYTLRQKDLGRNITFDNKRFAQDAVDILEEATNHNKQQMALTMQLIIEKK